ncbi:hypothetical protein J6590_032550 [Homalodisca vitripennis]|nr:hypothetical protein J6590_032550 [Homalodisca vitripennis]
MAAAVDYSARNGVELANGCDANSHCEAWVTTNTRTEGIDETTALLAQFESTHVSFLPESLISLKKETYNLSSV